MCNMCVYILLYVYVYTLPETSSLPLENGWLEYDPFLLGYGLFSGAFAVSFREGMCMLGHA